MDEEACTTSTENIIYTPTRSSDSSIEEDLFRLSLNRNSIERGATCPWREKTYVLVEKFSKRVMALRHGKIVLIDTQGFINHFVDFSCHWHCSENKASGWWGFCNAASGMFLGEAHTSYNSSYGSASNAPRLLVASSKAHNESQWIYIKQHPDGGHELFVNRHGTLAAVTFGKKNTLDQALAVGENGTPIRWNFIEV